MRVELWAEACGRQQFDYHPAEYLRHADVPTGEFWMNRAASRAHRAADRLPPRRILTGDRKVAGESFTAAGQAAIFPT